jgi:hypothetical protein
LEFAVTYTDIVSTIRETYKDASGILPVMSRLPPKKIIGWTFEATLPNHEVSTGFGWTLPGGTISADLSRCRAQAVKLVRVLSRTEQ